MMTQSSHQHQHWYHCQHTKAAERSKKEDGIKFPFYRLHGGICDFCWWYWVCRVGSWKRKWFVRIATFTRPKPALSSSHLWRSSRLNLKSYVICLLCVGVEKEAQRLGVWVVEAYLSSQHRVVIRCGDPKKISLVVSRKMWGKTWWFKVCRESSMCNIFFLLYLPSCILAQRQRHINSIFWSTTWADEAFGARISCSFPIHFFFWISSEHKNASRIVKEIHCDGFFEFPRNETSCVSRDYMWWCNVSEFDIVASWRCHMHSTMRPRRRRRKVGIKSNCGFNFVHLSDPTVLRRVCIITPREIE